MDFIYEKIAGTGLARKYNLEKCRKELERSCSNYQAHVDRLATSRATRSSSAHSQQLPSPKEKNKSAQVPFQTHQSTNETAHVPRKSKEAPIQYVEKDIRRRTRRLKAESRQKPSSSPYQAPFWIYDPFDGYTGNDFANDFDVYDESVEQPRGASRKYSAPYEQPLTRRQTFTLGELIAIRKTAVRIARHCKVRDKEPCTIPTRQEVLHRIRTAVWMARMEALRAENDGEFPDENKDDNGIRITEDGCIIQRGFDVSPMNSSPMSNILVRCDSGCETQCKTPNHVFQRENTPQEPMRSNVRNAKGARIPVCFRKQEILAPRKASSLSALFSSRVSTDRSTGVQHSVQSGRYQEHVSQQRHRMPVPARPVVFFAGSASSEAIASDSDEGNEGEDEEADEVDSDGSIATAVPPNKPAKTTETNDRLPQRSAPLSPPLSGLPVPSPRRSKQDPQPLTGTPLPQRLSKFPEQAQRPVTGTPRAEQFMGRPSPLEQRRPQPQGPRSQQTTRVFMAHQQQRYPQPLPPRARSPCTALGMRIFDPLNGFSENDNHVSFLLAKIERNGGIRPPNFSWDHVAPMHGFSSCTPFYVLD